MLTEVELVVAGLVASVVTQVLRIIAARLGYSPSRVIVNIALLALALVLAGVFRGLPELPPLSDPLELAQALLGAALAVVGTASFFYNVLLDKVIYPRLKLASPR